MSKAWKPGDVAAIRDCHTEPEWRAVKDDKGWSSLDPSIGWVPDFDVIAIRPLVVIDPKDAPNDPHKFLTSLSRLWGQAPDDFKLYGGTNLLNWLASQFEPPKPAKPEEPTGLGAVVRARQYAEINAVRVLSEGVQP